MCLASVEAMTDIFEFKTFKMRQAPSGQRVNTDSCVFGAVIGPEAAPRKIVDIGSGTGVLSLMFAARFPGAEITAVEPEEAIAAVARQNFADSPWASRIALKTLRAQDLAPDEHGLFDFVVCNPPYFQNSMTGDDRLRATARHNTDLSPHEIYQSMHRMLTGDGSAWLSFAIDSADQWEREGFVAGLFATHKILVKDHPDARAHITIMGWAKNAPLHVVEDVIHYRESHQGRASAWMRAFRDEWFPERFNALYR